MWVLERGVQLPLHYEFEWTSVNEELDRKLFEVEGLDLPDGTQVINRMVEGQRIMEAPLGEEPLRFDPQPLPPVRDGIWPPLIWFNLLLVAGGLALTASRWWTSQSAGARLRRPGNVAMPKRPSVHCVD